MTTANGKVSGRHKVTRPLGVQDFVDGLRCECQGLEDIDFRVSNVFLESARVDTVFLKFPTKAAMRHHEGIFKGYLVPPGPNYRGSIRPLRGLEEPERLDDALRSLPEFSRLLTEYRSWGCRSSDKARVYVHFLLLHLFHYDAVKAAGSVAIPKAHFVFLQRQRRRWFWRSYRFVPAIVQAAVTGVGLWEMYDKKIPGIRPEWRQYIREIQYQLLPILDDDNFDWHPNNFLFNVEERKVYYVDSKPTTFQSLRASARNLWGIKEFFFRREGAPTIDPGPPDLWEDPNLSGYGRS